MENIGCRFCVQGMVEGLGRSISQDAGHSLRKALDNEKIEALAKPESFLFSPFDFRGPTVYLRNAADAQTETAIGRIIARYSQDILPEYPVRKKIVGGAASVFPVPDRFPAELLETLRIS